MWMPSFTAAKPHGFIVTVYTPLEEWEGGAQEGVQPWVAQRSNPKNNKTKQKHKQQLLLLLPPGPTWPRLECPQSQFLFKSPSNKWPRQTLTNHGNLLPPDFSFFKNKDASQIFLKSPKPHHFDQCQSKDFIQIKMHLKDNKVEMKWITWKGIKKKKNRKRREAGKSVRAFRLMRWGNNWQGWAAAGSNGGFHV